MPHCPALPMVAMLEQATQSGGCGFWYGLGMTLRAGKSKYLPCHSQVSRVNAGTSALTDSPDVALLAHARAEGMELDRPLALAQAQLDAAL